MTKKKKILLLSDDLRMHSGIATVSKEIVLGTAHEYDWVQLGAAVTHPDQGKILDLSQELQENLGIKDANVKIYPWSGYGNPDILRELINIEQPDAILHFTDPRFWGWLYQMEHELRQSIPIFYYTIWDDTPYPMYNKSYYQSCDLLMCISKQTYNIVKNVLKDDNYEDWQITYVPHGINENTFFPIREGHKDYEKFLDFKNRLLGKENPEFIFLYNNRNIRRKHASDLIIAYNEFCNKLTKEQASKCLLIMHTEPVDENGTDLPAVIKDLGVKHPIKFTNVKAVPQAEINFLYNLADVTVNIASNEGFGLGTAESIMTGTPIIVNVTGGLQDQCGFKKADGTYLTEHDYTDEFPTNADGVYKEHGEWCAPVFPAVRTLQGSVPTPYIFDDIVDYKEVAEAMMYWYGKSKEEREEAGIKGQEYFKSVGAGLSAKEMSNRFIKDMNTAMEKWQPRKRFEIVKM
jgi:glycosyltransferase involved in cell wall biosynthesis